MILFQIEFSIFKLIPVLKYTDKLHCFFLKITINFRFRNPGFSIFSNFICLLHVCLQIPFSWLSGPSKWTQKRPQKPRGRRPSVHSHLKRSCWCGDSWYPINSVPPTASTVSGRNSKRPAGRKDQLKVFITGDKISYQSVRIKYQIADFSMIWFRNFTWRNLTLKRNCGFLKSIELSCPEKRWKRKCALPNSQMNQSIIRLSENAELVVDECGFLIRYRVKNNNNDVSKFPFTAEEDVQMWEYLIDIPQEYISYSVWDEFRKMTGTLRTTAALCHRLVTEQTVLSTTEVPDSKLTSAWLCTECHSIYPPKSSSTPSSASKLISSTSKCELITYLLSLTIDNSR